MEPVRSLRDVFADLADHTVHSEPTAGPDGAGASVPDPRSVLADYADLPDDLLVTAIDSYANTAPAEVAEHLASFVATPGADPSSGLDLLASAPTGVWEGEVDLPGWDRQDDLDSQNDLDGEHNLDGEHELASRNDPDNMDDLDGKDGEDPGLQLGDLDHADSLDLAATSGFEHGFEDSFGPAANAGEHPAGEDAGTLVDPGDPTENRDPVENGDPVEDSLAGPSDQPAGGPGLDSEGHHDYLGHQLVDHPAELGDLESVNDFDEFDADEFDA